MHSMKNIWKLFLDTLLREMEKNCGGRVKCRERWNQEFYFDHDYFQGLMRHPTGDAGKEAGQISLKIKRKIQFSSVAQSCPTLCDPMNCNTPVLPVHHKLPEFTQTHVHRVGDAIQPSHPLSSPSLPALNPSQHQGLFKWVNSSHEVAKVLEFQLQHQSFQWTPSADLL